MPTETSDFWKLFKTKCCSLTLRSTDQEGVFRELVENLVAGESLPAELGDGAVKALLDREAMASTGLGMGVAIPHVKIKGLERVAVSLSVHREGVAWQALDGAPVHLFFAVLRPERPSDQHDPDRHRSMMTWIAKLTRDADFRRFAVAAKTKKELCDLLKEKSGA